MVDEAILSSLRNALERGEDVNTAIRSMISAGYDRFEINEAAKVIIKEIAESQIPEGQRPQAQLIQQTPVASQTLLPIQSQLQAQAQKPKKKVILITAIIFLLLIAGILSYFLITKFI